MSRRRDLEVPRRHTEAHRSGWTRRQIHLGSNEENVEKAEKGGHRLFAKEVPIWAATGEACLARVHWNDSPVMYTDADWSGCSVDRRSYTGYSFVVGSGAVSWISKKQQTVALSSTEAEYT
ncbi:PREDICTED: uncharacterized protein LOC105459784 [Wasmannia auropunctata]|uniref:uncharacterized protein LOC105459784 n=1 Tax=Wasmannia auropunctata TaxID=64793 RepID=UPI0005EF9022|nr:PREDICTED: uncharacterized protein LOC105459784 [Wasmannia auropunctata]